MDSNATTGRSGSARVCSFQDRVREELMAVPNGAGPKVCALAALLSCLRTNVSGEAGEEFLLRTDNPQALEKCFTLLQKTANIIDGLSIGKEKMPKTVSLSAWMGRQEQTELLELLDLADENGNELPWDAGVSWSLIADENCFRAYHASMVLGIGSISDPEREYRLTFYCRSKRQKEQLAKLLADRELLLKEGSEDRLYTRDAEQIADLLNLSGAHQSLLAMENTRVVRQVRGIVNRKVNCETSKIRKTVQAARKQLADIELLKNSGVLMRLPENLQEIAEARLAFPDLTLEELGKRLNPPVGKSGVNHRLRRLQEEAGRLRGLTADGGPDGHASKGGI